MNKLAITLIQDRVKLKRLEAEQQTKAANANDKLTKTMIENAEKCTKEAEELEAAVKLLEFE